MDSGSTAWILVSIALVLLMTPGLAFMTFQMMFAIVTPALISGALVGRMKFRAYSRESSLAVNSIERIPASKPATWG